jgi:glucosyl-3-phosphoglycerate synthase
MNLPPPSPALEVCVVVPARDEEATIGRCLRALAAQRGLTGDRYEVLLVLDRCSDATEERARAVAAAEPDLTLHLLPGPGRGAGHARKVGMDAACERLLDLGQPEGLIASTDADTVVANDWLHVQLAAVARGAQAIGGRIELDPEERDDLHPGVRRWHAHQSGRRYRQLLASGESRARHWQFSGASMALTAGTYARIGGLAPQAALEDEHLERTLRRWGVEIIRPLEVKVRTSARRRGRAQRGLARDLALADWLQHNDLRPDPREPLRADRAVSVVLAPGADSGGALPELRERGVVREVIPATGELKEPLGLGDALWRSLPVANGEVVAFLAPGAGEKELEWLLAAFFSNPRLRLVQGYFGDRVPDLSRLVARPLLNLYRPELSALADPGSVMLAGERELLERLPFAVGSGFAVPLMMDAAALAGAGAIGQVDLGPAPPGLSVPAGSEAEAYALQVAVAARVHGREAVDAFAPGPLALRTGRSFEPYRVAVEERPPLVPARSTEEAGDPSTRAAGFRQ